MPLFPDEFKITLRAWDKNQQVMHYDQVTIVEFLHQQKQGLMLMQWIGHCDDSPAQKKIFQGDICEIEMVNEFGSTSKHLTIVAFNTNKAQFLYEIFSGAPLFAGNITMAVVIGNIHETPEIFKNPHEQLNQSENQKD